ncbi:MAG: winged helix-turn-helix domain-containing protein [Bacteroidales bacterium]|nr:winged helix-turn-helix domain-containing protein [Bacteroidales bacterium]
MFQMIQMHLTGQILSIIESNPSISRRELAERLGISERRTRDILKEMQDTGRLKRVGSTRGCGPLSIYLRSWGGIKP